MNGPIRNVPQQLGRRAVLLAVACAQVVMPVAAAFGQAASAPATQPATTTQPSSGRNGAGRMVSTTQGGGILLNFRDATIDAVLDQLSEAAGFVVVRETTISGRITLLSKQPVSKEEAVSLLNTVLKTNGYAAVQMGRTLKVMARDRAKTSNIPVHTGSDPNEVAETDELITQIIPIKSIDAVQLRNDLSPVMGDASVTANASSNSIVITDTSANIRRIVTIINSLDSHQSGAADVRPYRLKYASASAAAKLIMDVFGQTGGGGGGGGGSSRSGGSDSFRNFMFNRFGGSSGGGGFGGSPGGDGGRGSRGESGAQRSVIRVTASADDRTNTLVVSGPTDTLNVIEKVVKEIDADPVAEQSVFIYNLKNGQADNLAIVLNNLVNGTTGTTRSNTGTNNRNNAGNRSGFGNNSGRGGSRSSFGGGGGGFSSGSSFGGGGFGSGFGGGGFGGFGSSGFGGSSFGGYGGFGGNRSISSAAQNAASDLAGQVTVVPNEDTNSLLIMTAPKNFERVRLILDELDRAVPQVLIKVLVAEVTHDNLTDIGTEFSVLNLRSGGKGMGVGTDPSGAPTTPTADGTTNVLTPFRPGFGQSTPDPTQTNGGLVARITEANLSATFRALQTAGKLDVLSRPYILTSDNQLASIMIGQSVPYPTNSRVTDNGQIINSLSYRDVGIILNVTPHINPDGLVTLDVNPEVSSLTGQTIAITQGVGAPIFNQRMSQSRVAVLDGQTIVIGGMMEDRKTSTVNKVPLLGDLPGIGFLFSRTNDHTTKTELLFFLTPHVAGKPADLEGMSKDEMKGTKLTPNAVSPGTFQEHMQGMRRGDAKNPVGEPTTQPAESKQAEEHK